MIRATVCPTEHPKDRDGDINPDLNEDEGAVMCTVGHPSVFMYHHR